MIYRYMLYRCFNKQLAVISGSGKVRIYVQLRAVVSPPRALALARTRVVYLELATACKLHSELYLQYSSTCQNIPKSPVTRKARMLVAIRHTARGRRDVITGDAGDAGDGGDADGRGEGPAGERLLLLVLVLVVVLALASVATVVAAETAAAAAAVVPMAAALPLPQRAST
jgi:hypothetical protein